MNDLHDIFQKAFTILGLSDDSDFSVHYTHNTWGDYKSNIALKHFKTANQSIDNLKSPVEFGLLIVDNVGVNDLISGMTVTKPGFINIKVTNKYIETYIDHIVELGKPVTSSPVTKQTVVVDYSSPNVAKEMHVGHLRSTIIGDVIANTFEYLGHNVLRVNHIGDWGTQFGMLIAYMGVANFDILDDRDDPFTISDLHQWYKESKLLFDSDPKFNELAHQRVVDLQGGDPRCLAIWTKICEISKSSYDEVYQMLNINGLTAYGESFYNSYLPAVVSELDGKGLLTTADNGAKLMFVNGKKVPLIVQKGDGGYGYDTTDLAAVRYRVNELKADRIVYVTDSGQSLHFDQVFEGAKKASWIDNTQLDHVGFGVVVGEDGKRIKSRSGDSIKLTDLLNEAKTTYCKLSKESETTHITEDKLESVSELIGWSAVKYADLRQNRLSNYKFDFDKMLDNKGDTVVYLLYAWVRILNIIRKSSDFDGFNANTLKNIKYQFVDLTERSLALHLTRFDETLQLLDKELLPNHLCEYLHTLSVKVNDFWRDCRVLSMVNNVMTLNYTRLKLCIGVKSVMKACFDILKIPVDGIQEM